MSTLRTGLTLACVAVLCTQQVLAQTPADASARDTAEGGLQTVSVMDAAAQEPSSAPASETVDAADEGVLDASSSVSPESPPNEIQPVEGLMEIAPVREVHEPTRASRCHERESVHDIADLDLEALLHGEVATSYSRSAERVDDAPVAVTVVTREQIRAWGYQSVSELLEDVVGFYGIDDQMVTNVAVRGITGGQRSESSGLKVMINGRPVSFRPTGGNWLGPELIPMSAVERIEIVRGPASTVYGADAFLGVINVVTRSGEDICGADVWSTGNYAGQLAGGIDATIGGRVGRWSAIVSARYDRVDRSGLALPNSSPSPALRLGVMRTQLSDRLLLDSRTAFTQLTYHFDPHNSISLTGQIAGIDRNGDFATWSQLATGFDSFGRPRGTRVSLIRGYLNLSGDFQPLRNLQIVANAGFFGGAPTPDDRIDVNSDVYYVRRLMDFKSFLVDATATWTPIETLRLVAGADYLLDHETLPGALRVLLSDSGTLHAGDVVPAVSTSAVARDFQNLGVFVLGTWTPTGDHAGRTMVRTDAGIRFDYNDLFGSQVNGRVGISLRIIDRLTFRANYSSAFRAPTSLLLFGTPLSAGDILGNQLLQPEQIHAVESGLLFRPWSWLRIQSTVAFSYVRNEAEFVLVGENSVARNLAELRIWSWETDVRVNWTDRLSAFANFALVDGSRNVGESGYIGRVLGSNLEVYPPEVVNAGATYRLPWVPLRFMVRARWISERTSSDTNAVENGAVYTLPAAFYLDASATLLDVEVLPGRKSTLTLIGRNILDNRAAHPGFSGIDYPSAPRTVFLQWQQEL